MTKRDKAGLYRNNSRTITPHCGDGVGEYAKGRDIGLISACLRPVITPIEGSSKGHRSPTEGSSVLGGTFLLPPRKVVTVTTPDRPKCRAALFTLDITPWVRTWVENQNRPLTRMDAHSLAEAVSAG